MPLSSDLSPAFAPNPNKGATRTKKLGLWGTGQLGFPDDEWHQLVTVERSMRPKTRVTKGLRDKGTKGKETHSVASHSFPLSLCPSVPKRKGTKGLRNKWTKGKETYSVASHSVPLSFCPSVPVLTPPAYQHFLRCPAPGCNRKVLKLMMVLATEAECNDADLAEGWVRMIDAHPRRDFILNNTDLGARYADIVRRYGLLFRGRRLLCRNCLGVRYGEVKPKRRLKNDLIIIKNPRTSAGGRRRSPQRATKLTREQRAALRTLRTHMQSIHRANTLFRRVQKMTKAIQNIQPGHPPTSIRKPD